jgi:hypothetical protein
MNSAETMPSSTTGVHRASVRVKMLIAASVAAVLVGA